MDDKDMEASITWLFLQDNIEEGLAQAMSFFRLIQVSTC
jgi:hypothetical protein